MRIVGNNLAEVWISLLKHLIREGREVRPRGFGCRETTGLTIEVADGTANILANPERRLSYRFQVAEWLWIWFGHDDVFTIAQYNKQIAQFSDDGIRFQGAYGPKVIWQWPLVERSLIEDQDTRQAVINIFQPPRRKTKDMPCTLTIQFLVRAGRLETIVNMRSSDTWLGLPYDFFNFSMLGNIMAASLAVPVGKVVMNLGSSHLYDSNLEAARRVLEVPTLSRHSPQLSGPPPRFVDEVLMLRSMNPTVEALSDDDPWKIYCRVLLAGENDVAFLELMKLCRG